MNLISRECSMYLGDQNQVQFLNYQKLSGLGFNKLGLYQECIQDAHNQYYLLQAQSNIFNPVDQSAGLTFMSGLCFNKICTANDLEYALTSLQQYIPKMSFHSFSISTPSYIQQEYDIETIIVMVVLSMLLGIWIICSGIDWFKGKKMENNKIIQCFSIFTSIKILSQKSQRSNDRVKAFSGIKALCLIAIAMTNIGRNAYFAPTTSFYSQTQDQSIYALFYGVDIWLMVSGFFITYRLMKQYHSRPKFSTLLLKVLRRFFRLWPIYLVALLINWNILPLIGGGPLWSLLIDFPSKYCNTYLPHLFMFSNLTNQSCYNSLWLLQIDLQLCLLFSPLLFLYLQKQKSIKFIFYIIQIIFIVWSFFVALLVNQSQAKSLTKYFFLIEYNGWNIYPISRCGGYLVGYNLGILYYRFKKSHRRQNLWWIKILNRKIMRVIISLIGMFGLIGVGISFDHLDKGQLNRYHYFYFAVLRMVVPILMVLLMVSSLFGYTSMIKNLLQNQMCNFISKISLGIFGINYSIALYLIYYRQFDLELSNFTVVFLAFCTIIPSILIALLLTSIVEVPVFTVKKFLGGNKRIGYFQH